MIKGSSDHNIIICPVLPSIYGTDVMDILMLHIHYAWMEKLWAMFNVFMLNMVYCTYSVLFSVFQYVLFCSVTGRASVAASALAVWSHCWRMTLPHHSSCRLYVHILLYICQILNQVDPPPTSPTPTLRFSHTNVAGFRLSIPSAGTSWDTVFGGW